MPTSTLRVLLGPLLSSLGKCLLVVLQFIRNVCRYRIVENGILQDLLDEE